MERQKVESNQCFEIRRVVESYFHQLWFISHTADEDSTPLRRTW